METKKLEQFSIDVKQGIVSINNKVENGIYEFILTFKDGKLNLQTCQDKFYASVSDNHNFSFLISTEAP